MPRKPKPEPVWESEQAAVYQAMRLNGMTADAAQVMWNDMMRTRERFKIGGNRLRSWWGRKYARKLKRIKSWRQA